MGCPPLFRLLPTSATSASLRFLPIGPKRATALEKLQARYPDIERTSHHCVGMVQGSRRQGILRSTCSAARAGAVVGASVDANPRP